MILVYVLGKYMISTWTLKENNLKRHLRAVLVESRVRLRGRNAGFRVLGFRVHGLGLRIFPSDLQQDPHMALIVPMSRPVR